MAERDDEFDDIVKRLGLDLTFPTVDPELDDEPESEELDGAALASHTAKSRSADEDEHFYRRVSPRAPRPPHRGRTLAWAGLIGSPLVLVIATLFGQWLSNGVLLAAALTFVASAIYLISQLPEHGPSQPDWPDDGAEL